MILVGSTWLKEYFGLKQFEITHQSFIDRKESIETNRNGTVEQVYGIKYKPSTDAPLSQIEFLLKYDDINLDFLFAVFNNLDIEDVIRYIEASPTGKYAKKIGFLYEFLTGKFLELSIKISGNYVDLLDPKKCFTGKIIKNSRWLINNNMLGDINYCPVVRRVKTIELLLQKNIAKEIQALKKEYTPEIFKRATNYLYTKETRSSFEIEKETPAPDRTERFVALLNKAGEIEIDKFFEEQNLVSLQNAIVDERFAATHFRDFQNYIGQTMPGLHEMIHYICPPPEIVKELMQGLKNTAIKTSEIPGEISAAILAFGFVFIHPFEDGNGRLHRYLIHDILVRSKIVPEGLIIPVSAHMLNNIKKYDDILEAYSKQLMKRVKYTKNDLYEIEIANKAEVENMFRYPDLTNQCIYLLETLYETVASDMPNELMFIQRYDEVKKAFQQIVDMPDKQLDLMIQFIYQNKGVFPKRRRSSFSKLIDEEIAKMEEEFNKIFEK